MYKVAQLAQRKWVGHSFTVKRSLECNFKIHDCMMSDDVYETSSGQVPWPDAVTSLIY